MYSQKEHFTIEYHDESTQRNLMLLSSIDRRIMESNYRSLTASSQAFYTHLTQLGIFEPAIFNLLNSPLEARWNS